MHPVLNPVSYKKPLQIQVPPLAVMNFTNASFTE